MAGHRRLLAIALGIAALAVAGCGDDPEPQTTYGQPTYYDPSSYYDPSGTASDPAADYAAQQQAIDALDQVSNLSYQSSIDTANNMTP
ncbi:MAG: hypothetical protein ABW060_08915 [Solirubrobacteraceae bacterium]